jgi:hypothetical protein
MLHLLRIGPRQQRGQPGRPLDSSILCRAMGITKRYRTASDRYA